jgi:predicted acetyltransferase
VQLTEEDFTFQHLETDEDIEQNIDIQRKVFGSSSGVDLLVKKLIYNHAGMTLKNHFVIKHRSKTVATLNLIPSDWSVGGIPLKVAEMGNVATLPEYRNRGLIRRLVSEYHKEVAGQGYALSVIEGIPYFYRQFGYEYALPLDEETTIPLERLPSHQSRLEIRPFTDKDVPRAMKLLAQTQNKFYVHSVRDELIWKMQQETGFADGHTFEGYIVEEKGEVTAYFRLSRKPEQKQLVLREASNTDRRITEATLSFIKELGQKNGFEVLLARTSHCDPLTIHLVTLGAEQRAPPYAWQIRVTDYVSMFRKMKPLFEERLATSSFHNLTEQLNFNFRRYVIQMSIENGVIVEIRRLETGETCPIGVNPLVFTQLLFGHRNRHELEMNYPDFHVLDSHKQLVDVLFPKLSSYVHDVY